MVDLEKVKAEKRELEVKKAVTDRYEARLRSGWFEPQARALGDLEYERGGGALTQRDLWKLSDATRDELHSVRQEIRGIKDEGRRLEQAAEILGKRDRAAADVERFQSPVAKVMRWFSGNARKEFHRAQGRFSDLNREARSIGTASGADMEMQRSRWLQEKERLPELQEKGSMLSRILDLASRALDGFAQEQMRYLERTRPERPRDLDRGR